MTEELPDGENEPLRRGIYRHVRGLLDNVKTLEMNPHGMSRVSKSGVSESIGGKQIAELVVGTGLRNAENRNKRDANDNDAEADEHYGKTSATSQANERELNQTESFWL